MKTDGLERADFFKVPEGIKFYVYGSGKDTITLVQQIIGPWSMLNVNGKKKTGCHRPEDWRHPVTLTLLIVSSLLQGVHHNLRS